jgi:hypothetical protein
VQSVAGVCLLRASKVSYETRFVPQRGPIVQDGDERPSRPLWRSVLMKVRSLWPAVRQSSQLVAAVRASTRHALCSAIREALLAATALLTL